MVVVENTPEQHNMVVCTLCSCYPHPVLKPPPVWYKSAPSFPRRPDPRGVLKDWRRTAGHHQDLRVDPRRDPLPRAADAPKGTEG
jgi:nitrile hydratase